MPDRATITQSAQIGVESTPGTSVAANKLIQATDVTFNIKPKIQTYLPKGQKYPTVSAMSEEYTEGKLAGTPCYHGITYWLSSVLANTTPTQIIPSTGAAYQWVFSPSTTAADTFNTFTIEQGNAVRAHKVAYATVKEIELTFTRDKTSLAGALFSAPVTDGITMTSSPTAIPLTPVVGNQINIYLADSQSGLAGASALTRPFETKWKIADRYNPVWVMNTAQTSFASTVEKQPKGTVTLLVEADSAGMALLTTMRANAKKFMRIKAVGAQIDGGGSPTYQTLQLDTALLVTDVSEFKDKDGVYAIQWTFEFAYDSTWGYTTQATVINTLTAL